MNKVSLHTCSGCRKRFRVKYEDDGGRPPIRVEATCPWCLATNPVAIAADEEGEPVEWATEKA